ncbi:hypothetical protein VNO78_21359 [Psophocarpus tetragonolobus]|uniref:HSF-type DNA-binding domain-containing protein n=1 Tax=Psophocarpus tetragonolobus TaxID=3891 RepID=A0AAN9SCN7_PSOTE
MVEITKTEEESDKRKLSPPPFLLKTYMLVEDPSTNDVVSWNCDGTTFVVLQPVEFARDLLPTLFKHNNFSSFVRQLNTYGFRKVATSQWEFCNDRFRKGEKELLCKIKRKKTWVTKQQPTIIAPIKVTPQDSDEEQRSLMSASSSSSYAVLMDENKRLKKENGVLSSELTTMKRKCKELLDLVAKYSCANEEGVDERPMLFKLRLEEVRVERELKIIEERGDMSGSTSIFL